MKIWIDADACPNEIKQVVFHASERLEIPVTLVANVPLPQPRWPLVSQVLVSHDFDAADDHIAEAVGPEDLVICADIPLAARVVEKGAVAIDPRGELYDATNVGERLAMRDLMQELRSGGYIQGGPATFGTADKAKFAATLERTLTRRLKGKR